jgi:hypothetical protein
MTKPARDEAATKDAWIQERLGERKYRQLRMHLSGALRLLGELATVPEEGLSKKRTDLEATDLKVETTKAMAALSERLRALPRAQQAIRIRKLSRVKGRRKPAVSGR